MKNKSLFFKIITIITVFTVILSVLCISSSAYTISNSSAIYNNQGKTFVMPGYNSINLKNTSSQTDIPSVLSYPICDYYGRDSTVIGSFVSTIDNVSNISWYAGKTVETSNYYSTGYIQTGEIKVNSTATNFTFDYYSLDSIVLRDYCFDDYTDMNRGATCALELYLYEPELYNQFVTSTNSYVESLKVNYSYKYYDKLGNYREDSFDTKLYGFSATGGSTNFYVYYFPLTYYTSLGETIDVDTLADNPVYTNKLIYLDELVITIDMDDYDINFMTDKNQDFQALQRSVGRYTNRLTPSNLSSYVDMITDYYDLGYNRGESDGYSDGYRDGVDADNPNFFNSIMTSVGTFLDWEFIDGISMAGILSIVLGVCLVITFLKFFAGG